MNPYRNEDLRSFIESIPRQEIEEKNREELEQAERDYRRFKAAVAEGVCLYCEHRLDSFDQSKPCLHWFTYPNGIKKKHFEKYLSEPLSLFQLEAYFRWMASTEKIIGNVNDSIAELSKTSLIEMTVAYKNIEWSLSVGQTDVEGHSGSLYGAVPHYHVQMIVA